jgi:hypothetical protein
MRLGQLTERETAGLVIAAGRKAGYLVRTEIIVTGNKRSGRPGQGEIDVGWYDRNSNSIRVAWEIDGHDAAEQHFFGEIKKDTMGNKEKFAASKAPLKIQVLYSLKNNLQKKAGSKESLIKRWLGSRVSVVTDEQLMQPGGIERWMTAAGLGRVRNQAIKEEG